MANKSVDLTPEQVRAIATRRVFGASLRDLENEFGYSRTVINRYLSTDAARAIMKGISEDAVKGAVAAVKKELSDMTTLALTALRKNLEQNNMEAVKTYFKALGLDNAEKEAGTQNQAIQVILPGQVSKEPKDVIQEG